MEAALHPFVYNGQRRRALAETSLNGRIEKLTYRLVFQIDGVTHMSDGLVLRPGQTALLNPGVTMSWKSPAYYVRVPFDLVYREKVFKTGMLKLSAFDQAPQPPLSELLDLPVGFTGKLPEAMQDHGRELAFAAALMRPKSKVDVLRVSARLGLLLAELQETSAAEVLPVIGGETFCCQVERLLMQQSTGPVAITEIADQLRMHSVAMTSKYKKIRGFGPKRFLQRYRVERAKGLLKAQPDMPQNAVAEAVGFSGAAVFRKNFRDVVGCAPRAWLRNLQP